MQGMVDLKPTVDDIDAEVTEVEEHLHNRERWFGKLGVQTATDWADDTLSPYQAISGDNAYGADGNDEAQAIGTDDTPVTPGMTKFDFHRLMVIGVSEDTVYKLRIVWGTGTMDDAIGVLQYTEIVMRFDSVNPQHTASVPVPVIMERVDVDTKIWVQAWNVTNNATIDFLVGLHEYLV